MKSDKKVGEVAKELLGASPEQLRAWLREHEEYEADLRQKLEDEYEAHQKGCVPNAERLERQLREGRDLIRAMDANMPAQATEDEDGFINSYRIPVGPWHRLLAWASGASFGGGTRSEEE